MRGGWIPRPELPERLTTSRWQLAPRHLVVLALVLLIGLTWAGCAVLRARPEPVPGLTPTTLATGAPVAVPSAAPSPVPGSTPGPISTPAATTIVVHVAGKVRRPGLVRTTPGARVADAITTAGGPLPGTDLSQLNLARPITDGEQIVVGAPAAPTAAPSSSPPVDARPTPATVNLNTATAAELDTLPGVGPVLAQRIVDYRTDNGPFSTVDQLQDVSGVGTKKFEDLKPHVRV